MRTTIAAIVQAQTARKTVCTCTTIRSRNHSRNQIILLSFMRLVPYRDADAFKSDRIGGARIFKTTFITSANAWQTKRIRPFNPALRVACGSRQHNCNTRNRTVVEIETTLSQEWSRNSIQRPQCAFELSMFMCPAVHKLTRNLLRSSSTHEPSDPPFRVIFYNLQDAFT